MKRLNAEENSEGERNYAPDDTSDDDYKSQDNGIEWGEDENKTTRIIQN